MTKSTWSDPREEYFGGMPWYESLSAQPAPTDDSAWYVAKDHESAWDVCLLKAALRYADSRGLRDFYCGRFATIHPADVSLHGVDADRRDASLPVWEIANELVVAAYLERVLGWAFVAHEPAGRGERHGDWEFTAPDGQHVFVEVKTLAEPPWRATSSSGIRPSHARRLQNLLARAYRQLPHDDRATMVVIVGHDFIRIPFGTMHGDLYAALFGQFIMQFTVMVPDSHVTYAGPSWHDMLVHHTKRRHLGVVAGLVKRGVFTPEPLLYAIHNPFADARARLSPEAFGTHVQFAWGDKSGQQQGKPDPDAAWVQLATLLDPDDGCQQLNAANGARA